MIITGSTTSFSSGDEVVFVMKVSSNGQITWSKAYSGLNIDFPRSIIETSKGDLKEYLVSKGEYQVFGAPHHPQMQGKIERYHGTIKNVVKL